jgi:hypothetical protein
MRSSQGIRDTVNRVINVMILVIIYNNAAVLSTRTASTVHNTEVISLVLYFEGQAADV